MPDTQLLSDITADGITGHRCPICGVPMMLIRIKPSHFGFDLRTFECADCFVVEKMRVDTKSKRRRSGISSS